MKKILFAALLSAFSASAQNVLTLDTCIARAKQNYPLIKQNDLIIATESANMRAISENWYPHLSFLAKGTYQTEVVQFDFPGMNIAFPHDSYLANLSLDQTIFDGGQSKKQKQLELLNTGLELQRNEVELYKLIDRVNQLYVNILLSRENIGVLGLYKNNIDNRRQEMIAAEENGLVLESSLDELEAESLKTDQNIIEAEDNLDALYKTLAFYIGMPVGDATEFSTEPIGGEVGGSELHRPELKVFNIQKELLESKYELATRYALPKLSVFAGANYGRPGPNFINQELRFFGDAGVSLKWNINTLYGLSREKTKYRISQQAIDVQQELFLFNLNNTLTSQTAQINSLLEMIDKDKIIVEKRHNVTQTASAQLENGKITVNDYLTQLNAELQATLNQKIHEIRLMNAKTTYNTTRGINTF